jgi:hypothetical protein
VAVTFDLPTNLEQELRGQLADLDGQAREALLVAMYRTGRLSHVALCQALGLDRLEAEELLHKHNVTEDLGTVDDYLAEVRSLQALREPRG